jgi:hypothetical protein
VSTAITAGANCYWDAAGQQVATTTATGNKLIGKTIAPRPMTTRPCASACAVMGRDVRTSAQLAAE